MTKKEFEIHTIKTPKGQVPTIESFHKVVDGLFTEVLDTRKDFAKLLPNLENELELMRKILAQQRILFETLTERMKKLEEQLQKQDGKIDKLDKKQSELIISEPTQAELTDDSKKIITKLIRTELKKNTKPLINSLEQLKQEIVETKKENSEQIDQAIIKLKDQIEDLSSKTELQLLEILETLNQKSRTEHQKTTKSKSNSTKNTKKKISS
ncbi:MAG: hypothetical protein GF308_13850 [Candidatus Heimdallarchaeota archaeon]|nr:hypothetical protein [Candidatus Heimdallarchaeota archaeon]